MRFFPVLSALVLPLAAPAVAAPALPADPLGSPLWTYHAKRLFGAAPVVFDGKVKVIIPEIAENQHEFPVTVDARALPDVVRIVVFEDLNPIPYSLDFKPLKAQPFIAVRIKLDQRTPVRGAALTADGVWHVAGGWIDAAGGGCSAPPVSRVAGDWAQHLGEMRGRAWSEPDGKTRLRVTIRHPMDTGLVDGIPSYHLERLTVRDQAGDRLAEMAIDGSVSEDPAFTMIVDPAQPGALAIAARDTNGLEFGGTIAPKAVAALP
jgi:sulfur-oxidizing protein SoxY